MSFPVALLVAGCGRRATSPSGIVAISVRCLNRLTLECVGLDGGPIVLGVDHVSFPSDANLIVAAWSLEPGEQ